MPTPPTVEPTMPCLPLRTVPLDEHDTSYFADSASIRSFSIVFSVNMVTKIRQICETSKVFPRKVQAVLFLIYVNNNVRAHKSRANDDL